MLNKQGKVWGNTQMIFGKNNVSIHRIVIAPGGFCSKHCHEHKWNAFYVERGEITVKVWKSDYDLIDNITLLQGEGIHIKPGEYHQFINEDDSESVVYEIYWTELNEEDILRETVGGINK